MNTQNVVGPAEGPGFNSLLEMLRSRLRQADDVGQQVSILYWRCTLDDVCAVLWTIEFQFSIGDAL